MKYSSVIVTYNRKEKLIESVNSILNQTLLPDKVIIIDNASTDGTSQMLKDAGFLNNDCIVYIKLPQNIGGSGGFYEGIKRSLDLSKYDYLSLSDDDAVFEPDFFERIAQAVKKYPKYKAFCGTVQYESGKIQLDHRRVVTNLNRLHEQIVPASKYKDDFDVDTLSFVGCVINREVIESVGFPYKDFFIYFDDTEYSLRIRQVTRIKNVSSAVIIHKIPEPTTSQKKIINWKTYYGVRNEIYTKRIHSQWNLMSLYLTLKYARRFIEIAFSAKYSGVRSKAFKTTFSGFKDGFMGRLGKR